MGITRFISAYRHGEIEDKNSERKDKNNGVNE